MNRNHFLTAVVILLSCAVLAGCGGIPPAQASPTGEAPVWTAAPPEATPAPTPEPTPEPTPAGAIYDEEVYAAAVDALLEEYRSILPMDPENYDEEAHPEIPWYSAILLRYDGQKVFYGFYDFDGNGVEELVVSVGDDSFSRPIGIYAFDGERMLYLCKDQALGERATVSFADGVFTVTGSGGAASGSVITYRIGEDGYTAEIIDWYEYEYQNENDVTVTVHEGSMTDEAFDPDALWRDFDVPIEYQEL